MRIKSILAALLAVVISAGAFCVPAFAYTGEESEPTVQDAIPVSSEDTDTDEPRRMPKRQKAAKFISAPRMEPSFSPSMMKKRKRKQGRSVLSLQTAAG